MWQAKKGERRVSGAFNGTFWLREGHPLQKNRGNRRLFRRYKANPPKGVHSDRKTFVLLVKGFG
jgi:hypothetical protein